MTSVAITGGTFDHAHIGDTIYHFYGAGLALDDEYEFDEYIAGARAALTEQSERYVPLDLDPMVVSVDQELRLIDHAQTSLLDAFVQNRHMVVLGGAGAGKTSSLRHLVCRGDGDLLILVELGRFRRMGNTLDVDALLMLVGEQIMALGKKTTAPSVRLLRRLLQEEPVTLLFDGLNEVEASIRPACLQAIDDLRAQFGCRIVLSTRGHGFVPPKGWCVFRLRELTDVQVHEYVHRNAEPRVREIIEHQLEIDDNQLLRIPLFLKYVIDLVAEDDEADATVLAGSRATIVARYVRFLSKRDDAKLNAIPVDREVMHEVLSRLALKLQHVGQSLSRREAAALISDRVPDASQANALFDRIAARGLLIADERHIRFWHHTIQEYCYANGRRAELFRGGTFDAKQARRSFVNRADEDALTFATAEASDEELTAMMAVAAKVNPLLAIRWADDLAADDRGSVCVDALVETVQRKLRMTSRFSRVTYEKETASFGNWTILWSLLLMFSGAMVIGVDEPAFDTFFAAIATLMTIVLVVVVSTLILYPGCEYAASLAGMMRRIRHRQLHERLAGAFEQIMRSPLSRVELVAIAESAVAMPAADDNPLTLVEKSGAPYVAIRILGSSNDPRTPHALEALARSGRGNAYSIQALRTLSERGASDREEADLAIRLAKELSAEETIPLRVRRRVAKTTAALGRSLPIPMGWTSRLVLRGLGLLLAAGILNFLWVILIVDSAILVTDGWVIAFFWLVGEPFLVSLVLYAHAHAIGAKHIPGVRTSETASPRAVAVFALITAFIGPVALPVVAYVWNLPLVRLNARGPDFATARAIFEQLESGEEERDPK